MGTVVAVTGEVDCSSRASVEDNIGSLVDLAVASDSLLGLGVGAFPGFR